MPSPKKVAGALSKAVKGTKKQVVKKAPEMGKLDTFLQSVGDPNNISEQKLRQWEQMVASLNPIDRKRGTEFLGLSPDAKFPNQRILQRAGLMDPENLGKFPDAPAGRFPEAPQGRFPESPAGRYPEAPQNMGQYPEAPQGRFPARPEYDSPIGPQPERGLSKKAMVGIGALGAGGVYAANKMFPAGQPQPMASHMPTAPSPYAGKYKGSTNAAQSSPVTVFGNVDTNTGEGTASSSADMPLTSSSPMQSAVSKGSRAGGMGSKKPSGLTGVNGALPFDMSAAFAPDDSWMEQTFGSVDDSLASSQGALDKYYKESQPDTSGKSGGGFGGLMKTLGPLIAALIFGKMMGSK